MPGKHIPPPVVEIRNPKPEIRNPKPEARNQEPETRNPEPPHALHYFVGGERHGAPETLNTAH